MKYIKYVLKEHPDRAITLKMDDNGGLWMPYRYYNQCELEGYNWLPADNIEEIEIYLGYELEAKELTNR